MTYPSFFSLFERWVPENERVRAVGLANSGIPLGTVFGLVVTPLFITAWGWEWAFYLFGLLGFGLAARITLVSWLVFVLFASGEREFDRGCPRAPAPVTPRTVCSAALGRSPGRREIACSIVASEPAPSSSRTSAWGP